ncbi:MAG: sulfatase-like hydrolase/transferase [Alphaproteobacteria bacterium]
MGRLQAFLQSSGLDANTLVIFAGDHGEGSLGGGNDAHDGPAAEVVELDAFRKK